MFMSCVAVALVLGGEVPFQNYVLNTDLTAWDTFARDVTGDGKVDVLALCCDEKSHPLDKCLAIFTPDSSGAYPGEASFRVALDPTASAIFFAETDGKPPVEIVAADSEGAVIYRYDQGQFARVAAPRFTSLLPNNTKQPVFLREGIQDLNGDGIDEWVLPMPSGYEVRTADRVLAKTACDVASDIFGVSGETLYISHRLPSCHAFELPDQTQKGLAFLSDEFADFFYGENWSQHHRFKVPLTMVEKWDASSRMNDINGDKLPDLVVTQTKGTINMKVVTRVYLASAPFTYPETPNATYEADGAMASPTLLDVDGDKMQDLVYLKVPFGVGNIVNYFMRRKVTVRVEVYLFRDGAFPKTPTFVEKLTLEAPEGRERMAYALGDFNGDGRMDAAFGAGTDRLVIHTSSGDKILTATPWVSIQIPAFGVARSYDLDGDANKDLVMHHPGGKNAHRVDVVVF